MRGDHEYEASGAPGELLLCKCGYLAKDVDDFYKHIPMRILITFGQRHAHNLTGTTFDKDCVAAIPCKNYTEGRELAFKYFNGEFHNSYVEGEEPEDLMSHFPRGVIEV